MPHAFHVWGFGIDKTKWGLCVRGFWQTCLCSGFDGLFCWWHAVGCLGQHKYCCSIDHPLYKQDLLGDTFLGCVWLGVVCWGGVLCENCIVDANAIKKQQ